MRMALTGQMLDESAIFAMDNGREVDEKLVAVTKTGFAIAS